MTRIDVALGERGYIVDIEDRLLDRAGAWLGPLLARRLVFVVTDANVARDQLPRLTRALDVAGVAHTVRVVPSGEASKSWQVLGETLDWMIEQGIERDDMVVALGGGVVGDLAGFAAAIVKRGCRWVQVPTSLLAMVDAAVGGKTAVNLAAGKNMAGTFHQPAGVLIDRTALRTLPARHMRAGYAEIVKYGLIGDASFFGWCEANGAALIAGDRSALVHAIETSVAAKARIVAADERDRGERALLNLGHSFAHALEAQAGMGDVLLHGEAVAVGTVLAFELSVERGMCPAADAVRVRAHLASVGLPVGVTEIGCRAGAAALARLMMRDKKVEGGRITLILAEAIGLAVRVPGVEEREIAAFLHGRSA